jgi:hypothetical protein
MSMNSPLMNLRTIQIEQELRLRRLEEKSEIAEIMQRYDAAHGPKPGVWRGLGGGGLLQRMVAGVVGPGAGVRSPGI